MGLLEVFAGLSYPHLADSIRQLGWTFRDFAWIDLEARKSGLEGAVLNFQTDCLDLYLGCSGAFHPDLDAEINKILRPVGRYFDGWTATSEGGLEISLARGPGQEPLSIRAQKDGIMSIPFKALPLTAKRPFETGYLVAMLAHYMYDWTPACRTNFA